MVEKPNKLQPALVGGLVLGLLSSIPFVSLANICCCLWVLLGGAIAARMLVKRSPVLPVTMGDGAVVGLLAGAVGAGVMLLISVPLGILGVGSGMAESLLRYMGEAVNDPNVRQEMERAIEQMRQQSAGQRLAGVLFNWLISAVVTVAFATLGGIIGVAIFEKRKGQPPVAGPGGYPPPGYPPQGFTPPGQPPAGPGGGPQPPPGQPPYGGGEPPPY